MLSVGLDMFCILWRFFFFFYGSVSRLPATSSLSELQQCSRAWAFSCCSTALLWWGKDSLHYSFLIFFPCLDLVLPNLLHLFLLKRYRAVYDYAAADEDEVSFADGDLIVDVQQIDEGWMFGRVERTGQQGMLPANYVEAIWALLYVVINSTWSESRQKNSTR